MPKPNIINLKECVDRREYTIREFSKLGVIDLEFHTYVRYEDSNIKMYGNPDAKGCFTSHLLTIKKWVDTSQDAVGIFFEDDVDFETVQHWNFTFQEFVDSLESDWQAVQLCGIYENKPNMYTRRRTPWDHGIQCYMLKREYAEKLVAFYFDREGYIEYKMPGGLGPSVENNVLNGFGTTYTFPLFNHNINDFKSENVNPCVKNYNQQTEPSIYSYKFIKIWWEHKGSKLSLREINDGLAI
jgi:GR25 family glycosyltransferase involved in LPS biosynthesis